MNKLDGKVLKEALASAAANLSNKHAYIDTLNVFPVPDGDTGTNMSMTFENGVKEALKVGDSLTDVTKALSRGLLMGARGNSGVITSQIFRGFHQYLDGKDAADVAEIAEAFLNGTKVAYKAIMKPVEGTILTVIRESSEMANEYVKANPGVSIEDYFHTLTEEAKLSLERTPELLPVLKEVGVVDSGGQGLVTIFEGFTAYLDGAPVTYSDVEEETSDEKKPETGYNAQISMKLSEEGFERFTESRLNRALNGVGDMVEIHAQGYNVDFKVHTMKPGEVLNIGQRYGEFTKIQIENLQDLNKIEVDKNIDKENVVLAVSAGSGMNKLFKDFGVDYIISGGQTMNPSTEDFVEVINRCNCKNVIILPNNSNIIMAAKQVQDVINNKHIYVLETRSMQEGIAALAVYDESADINDNLENMKECIEHILSASITYAIKDTSFDGVEVKKNDYIAMFDKRIVCSDPDRLKTVYGLIDELKNHEDYDLLTIYVGKDGSKKEAAAIENYVSENTNFMVEIYYSKQPVYSYLFGLE
ncbi:MAG: DAK2 domain-containing protein [Erysipelotrichaceae bacterium]|nr:DAK2 domain-containing protein [Erysipelotrichaceae bacterium]